MNGFDPARMAMLTAGSGLLVGSVNDSGEPIAIRAWSAAIIDAETGRLRIAVSADDPRVTDDMMQRLVAVTAADVRTLDSVQVKGNVVAVEPPDEHDLELVRIQSESFFEAIHETDGDPIDGLRKLMPRRIVMIELLVAELFDQTPGPGAGARVQAAT